jgi:hypothetical protein
LKGGDEPNSENDKIGDPIPEADTARARDGTIRGERFGPITESDNSMDAENWPDGVPSYEKRTSCESGKAPENASLIDCRMDSEHENLADNIGRVKKLKSFEGASQSESENSREYARFFDKQRWRDPATTCDPSPGRDTKNK